MKNNYKYGRLYDFCVEDNYKTPGRGIIRRKYRVLIGIFTYFFLQIVLLIYILDVYKNTVLLIVACLVFFGFIYETRMGLISLVNFYQIKSIRKKSNLDILEQFCIYHNKDGEYIKIQEKQLIMIKYHPLKWTVVKILFRDLYRNKYVFRINLKNIRVKIHFSKAYKEEHFFRRKNKIEAEYWFKIDDLYHISNTKDFMIFIRDKYREISEAINNKYSSDN